jgi:hypothetical protein
MNVCVTNDCPDFWSIVWHKHHPTALYAVESCDYITLCNVRGYKKGHNKKYILKISASGYN